MWRYYHRLNAPTIAVKLATNEEGIKQNYCAMDEELERRVLSAGKKREWSRLRPVGEKNSLDLPHSEF
jgi:hypothetical protein